MTQAMTSTFASRALSVSAFYCGLAYIIGMLGFLLILQWPDTQAEQLALLAESATTLHWLYVIVYQFWALAMLLLSVSFAHRFVAVHPVSSTLFIVLGGVWAALVLASGFLFNASLPHTLSLYAEDQQQAMQFWQQMGVIISALGGGNELVGGIWMAVAGYLLSQTTKKPKAIIVLSWLAALAGVSSAFPGFGNAGLVFGLVQILWFLLLAFTASKIQAIE